MHSKIKQSDRGIKEKNGIYLVNFGKDMYNNT